MKSTKPAFTRRNTCETSHRKFGAAEPIGQKILINSFRDAALSARGNCDCKVIQYMACWIPVIESPVGVIAEIVEHGVNGFLAKFEAEWADALRTRLHDPALRTQMGEAGRRKVERDYSLQVWGLRVVQISRDMEKKGRTSQCCISA